MKDIRLRYFRIALFSVFFALTVYYIALPFFSPSELHLDIRLPLWVFYTIQTNFFVCIWYGFILFSLISRNEKLLSQLVSMSLTVYILLTGIVYWAVLVPMLGAAPALFLFRNIWTHAITPLFTLYCFLVFSDKGKINAKRVPLILLYPFLYLLFSYLYVFPLYGRYPYPFLNPDIMGGVLPVVLSITGMVAIFMAIAYFLRFLHNKN
ncbi:MAG TPA: Pr6Pr family membrane protein [Clostridia bacterium]|nr:Pr6Pr family membrane protein [Clostridia bacterium]HPQ46381.1 Pr6Pr family membrane protein [Clostridia bacterium]HRX41209.1 Pr6Pr family membrane protein [Clostridia bacterium]